MTGPLTLRRRPAARCGQTLALIAALVAVTGPGCRRPAAPAEAPAALRALPGGVDPAALNVILVTIDTLRADHVSCYGGSPVATPNLDRFAREGVRFDSAASTVPFTLPAHASIMTGLYPPRHGIRENVGAFLPSDLPTMAELLAASGRQTAGFVSAFVLDSRWGIGRGFERYFDDFEPAETASHNLGAVQRRGDETLAEALRWLDGRESTAPLFLWLHLYDPHDPYTPPEPWASQHPGRPYRGEVAWTDSLIGELRTALEARGLLERSLVVLTADHGEGLGDHGERFHGFFVYDTTVRVPLILRLPGAARAGTVIGDPVSHVDLLPTILDAVAAPLPKGLDGSSLLPAVAGGELAAGREVYSESFYPLLHYGWAPLRALHAERHKLIAVPRPELYDLAADRREQRNLHGAEPELAARLGARLERLKAAMEEGGPAEAAATDLDPEALERLRALGYLAGGGGVAAAAEDERPRADPKDMIDVHQAIMATQSQIGRGETAAAAEVLTAVLERDPEILDAHQMLGQVALGEERFAEAVEHFQRALALAPDHEASLHGLATAFRRMGRGADATLGFERLYEVSGGELSAGLPLAELYQEAGRLEDAAAVLERATARPEGEAVRLNRLGELRALQGRAAEAAGLFERALAADPQLPGPAFNLAVLSEEAGDEARAIALYEQAIERAPKHYQAQFNLGRLYSQRGEIERQRAMWEAAIASNPDFVRGYYYLAKLLMDEGRELSRAEELAREGIARDGDGRGGPLGWFVLADLLNRRGRSVEAQEALARGRALQSN
jgi:arylsulfatase A-like enzyme/Tfp pilus assembly protein PilF